MPIIYPRPKAIFFDLDGTLVDSVPDLAAAIDSMLCDLGLSVVGEDKVRIWVGNGVRKLVHITSFGQLLELFV